MSNKINPWKTKLKIGDSVMVHAYKYNGWLYRTWEYPIVVDFKEDFVVLALSKSKVLSAEEKSIRCFSSWVNKTTYWYLSPKHWYNIIVSVESDGIKIYINISSPYIYEEGAIKYYDFDLDFKINTSGQWREVDIKEFNDNIKKYNYPAPLVKIIKDVEKDLYYKIQNNYFRSFSSVSNISNLDHKYIKILNREKKK